MSLVTGHWSVVISHWVSVMGNSSGRIFVLLQSIVDETMTY
jgi:hypothetical protein